MGREINSEVTKQQKFHFPKSNFFTNADNAEISFPTINTFQFSSPKSKLIQNNSEKKIKSLFMNKEGIEKQQEQEIENSGSLSYTLTPMQSPNENNQMTIPIQEFFITSRSDATGFPFSDGFYVIQDFNFKALGKIF